MGLKPHSEPAEPLGQWSSPTLAYPSLVTDAARAAISGPPSGSCAHGRGVLARRGWVGGRLGLGPGLRQGDTLLTAYSMVFQVSAVPEPSTALLLGFGLSLTGVLRKSAPKAGYDSH